jgi:hypothetical protein
MKGRKGMEKANKILRVENKAQKILFDLELSGQISDGHWENAKPMSHHMAFRDSEVVVAQPGEAPGINFYLRRRYDFANGDLLECVGQRMLAYVRLGTFFSHEEVEDLDTLGELTWEKVEMPTHPGDYYDKKRAKITEILAKHGKTLEDVRALAKNEGIYGYRQLVKDLNAIKRATQTHIQITP